MLVHPYRQEHKHLLEAIPGTRILVATLGVIGKSVVAPDNDERIWTVVALYTPLSGRVIGGVRAKLVDEKGFFTFCNQRDLELLLGEAKPDTYCHWLGSNYVPTTSRDWCGFCVDEEDLLDDLYDRELEARAQIPVGAALPDGLGFERNVHNGTGNDYIENMMLLWDKDPESGQQPDVRMGTVQSRWVSIERTHWRERKNLWERL